MAAIDELINQISDLELRDRIQKEVDKLSKQKKFGLVFEEHLPECTPLYEVPIRRGAKVALKAGKVNDFYKVIKINGDKALCLKQGKETAEEFEIKDLVTIAEFGDPIYPYLKPVDTICNAPDSDLWHTLIEADNYHALQLLEYLYAGKVDCIYIDPPYNTRDKDWKYNNDYVDSTDAYRHSKWLSMMQKRLKLAKKLLNPNDSVLIVTIDEKEYLHLGCLLEELFPEGNIQMVSSVINRHGSMRFSEFTRVNEYIFYIRIGSASVGKMKVELENNSIHWHSLKRSGTSKGNFRYGRPYLFYPIYVDKQTNRVHSFGEPIIPASLNRDTAPDIEGCIKVFPIRKDGTEGVWALQPSTARDMLDKGYFRVGKFKKNSLQQYEFSYLQSGVVKDIEKGNVVISGNNNDGSIIGHYASGKETMQVNQWDIVTHDASEYGTNLVTSILGNRFSYPKSLYAVRDTLYYYVANKPNALIIDFFAGSGTTLHAVNLLNLEDGGHRRCIMVTNNEVSADEADMLSSKDLSPGDADWESLGIAHYVTWPRTVCSIEGKDINGIPLKGNYIDSDFPMAKGFKANAIFFKLGFLDKNAVALGRQFKEMLPTLWMKAGAYGPCPTFYEEKVAPILIYPNNRFAVLNDESAFAKFDNELKSHPEIETVYIVTDYEPGYCTMSKKLNVKNTYQLYRDYLDNFRLNTGRD